MLTKFFHNWWLLLIKGLLLAALGLYTLFNADGTLAGIVLYLGIMSLVWGAGEVMMAIIGQADRMSFLLEGLVDLVLGYLLLTRPGIVGLVPILIGIWVCLSGLTLLVRALRERKAGSATWGNWMVLSIVLIALALWLILDPMGTLISMTWLLGIVLLAFGLLIMTIAWKVRAVGRALKAIRQTR
jgi:uncharacterized membrane protein HdeD (DUF308 family)